MWFILKYEYKLLNYGKKKQPMLLKVHILLFSHLLLVMIDNFNSKMNECRNLSRMGLLSVLLKIRISKICLQHPLNSRKSMFEHLPDNTELCTTVKPTKKSRSCVCIQNFN